MNKLFFTNLLTFGLGADQVKLNHINVNDYKFVIKARGKWEEDIYCNSFKELTDTQKERIADQYVANHFFSLDNRVVNYILSKGWEDQEAPFSWDDVTNNNYYGFVTINGYQEELTTEERDELEEKFDRLVDRWYDYKEDVLQARIDKLEDEQSDLDDDNFEYDILYKSMQERLDRLQERYNRADEKHGQLDSTLDDLKSMDFDERHEIYQWFKVDRDTAHRLDELGESILDGDYWGRSCCGQSITLDHCIQTIAFNLLSTEL